MIKGLRKRVMVFMGIIMFLADPALAQQRMDRAPEAAIFFGLNQPLLLGGVNVEANYFTRKWVFDYSHGASLEFGNAALPADLKAQKLVAHLPYSAGFGIGYRFTS